MDGLVKDGGAAVADSSEVERIKAFMMKAIEQDIAGIAETMVGKGDGELLGKNEFELRDKVLQLGAHLLEATVDDRKKGGTRAAAQSVPNAGKTPDLSGGGRRRS